jgi:hypothetical protein
MTTMNTKKGEYSKEEDQYFLTVLQAVAYGIRLGKSIDQICDDVEAAPAELKTMRQKIDQTKGEAIEED